MNAMTRSEILVIGSGAGGAMTALRLAQAGREVCVLEQGPRVGLDRYGRGSIEALRRLYRRQGMTPLLGRPSIGFAEGACVGGSTEINSGFWHRTPPETLLRWKNEFELDASEEEWAPHFDFAEARLGVSYYPASWPKSTEIFRRGIEAMRWHAVEVPRAAPGCKSTNACAAGCPTGAKQGMSRSIIPAAEAAGARVISRCGVQLLLRDRDRVRGVLAEVEHRDGARELVRLDAEHVFLCAGPVQTPALLGRSGLGTRAGATLHIHPMLKVAAVFSERVDAQDAVLPLLQVKEFWPEILLGGAYHTPSHVAMILSDNWPHTEGQMSRHRNMASYYVAVKGSGRGSVRPSLFGDGAAVGRYQISRDDLTHLSRGLARLSMLLLRAGATQVHPAVQGLPAIRTEEEADRWLERTLPRSALSLTTVHAFSSCPAGQRRDRCTVDSFGRVHGYRNLYVSDASILPDSPGVNPQASVMAFASRNALHFLDSAK